MAYVGLHVHVRPDSPLSFDSYPEDSRVTVNVGDGFANRVTLFLDRAEIDRLAQVLAEARESLNGSPVKAAA